MTTSAPSVFQLGKTNDANAKKGAVDQEYEEYAKLFRETENHDERKVRMAVAQVEGRLCVIRSGQGVIHFGHFGGKKCDAVNRLLTSAMASIDALSLSFFAACRPTT